MTDDVVDDRPADARSRLVSTPLGKGVAVVVLLVGALWIIGPNTPAGPFRDRVDGSWEPASTIGLVQDWSIFSPNPRGVSLDVYAVVVADDGSTVRWDVPEFDPLVGAYRQYRWHKWQDRVRRDVRRDLWDPTAEWIAAQHRRDGELPAEVRLVRRWRVHEPLDEEGAVDGDWNEFEFHVWRRDR